MWKIKPPFSPADCSLINAAFQKGQVLSFPTETLYALGGNALNPELCEKIFTIKRRPVDKSLLILVDDHWLKQLSDTSSPLVQKFIAGYWPGPITLILNSTANTPPHLVGPNSTIALRHSGHPVVKQLITIGGCPLIGTSANLSGQEAISEGSEIQRILGQELDGLIDDGATLGGLPSTILDATSTPWKLVREGVITAEILKEFL